MLPGSLAGRSAFVPPHLCCARFCTCGRPDRESRPEWSDWTRVRSWSGTRCRGCSLARAYVDDTSHSSKAVQEAKVRVCAGLCESVFVNEPCVIKDSRVTIRVIRGTVLPVGCAISAACHTVTIAGPRPSHSVSHGDVQCVGQKREFVLLRSYGHIESLATSRSPAAACRPAILIENPDSSTDAIFRCRSSTPLVAGLNWRKGHQHQQERQPPASLHSCAWSCDGLPHLRRRD